MKNSTLTLGSLCLGVALALGGCQKPLEKGPKKKQQAAMTPGGQSQPGAPAGKQGGKIAGKPFTQKAHTSIDVLLADPKSFEGKTVRVKGVLVQHCHHRKAWFAMAKAKGAKQKLQIQTLPAFRVPDGVKNGQTPAEAEGVVQMRTVPEARAKHLAREHGLFGGVPASIKGPQYLPRLVATGARFL